MRSDECHQDDDDDEHGTRMRWPETGHTTWCPLRAWQVGPSFTIILLPVHLRTKVAVPASPTAVCFDANPSFLASLFREEHDE